MLLMKAISRALGMISTVILARLLDPADFGIVAIAMSFFSMIYIATQFGFDIALIQKQNASRELYDTAWTLNLCFGAVTSMVLLLVAEMIAAAYSDQRLVDIVYVISVLSLLAGLQNIGITDLRKDLDFDSEFYFATIPRFICFVVTITLAFYLRNYWALVAGIFAMRISTTVLSYSMHPFRPRFTFRAWDELMDFSKWMALRNILMFVNQRVPELLVGRMHAMHAVGYFALSRDLLSNGISDIVATVNRATFPGYARISEDRDRLHKLHMDVLALVSMFVMPASVGLALVADPLIPVVLGDSWIPCIPIVQVLSASTLLNTLNSNTTYILMALGNSRLPTMLMFLSAVIMVPAAYYFGNAFGYVGVALGVLVAAVVTSMVTSFVTLRHVGAKVSDMTTVHRRPALGTAVMASGMLLSEDLLFRLSGGHQVIHLLMAVVTGGIVFTFVVFCLWFVDGRPPGPERQFIDVVKASAARIARMTRLRA